METYTFLRAFADSWHLLFMFAFFIAVVVFAFRPGSKKVHEETKNMIFRNDDRPGQDDAPPRTDAPGNDVPRSHERRRDTLKEAR